MVCGVWCDMDDCRPGCQSQIALQVGVVSGSGRV